MTERITQDKLEAQLVRTNDAIGRRVKMTFTTKRKASRRNVAPFLRWSNGAIVCDRPDRPDRTVGILELQSAYGKVQIVRADNGNPLTKYGTKREAYNALEIMRKTVDILNGF